jgi:hypothetical protein
LSLVANRFRRPIQKMIGSIAWLEGTR